MITNAPLWRAGKESVPPQPLSIGEYQVIVVEPTDTVQFILDQLLPGEPAALFPTQVDDTVRPVDICLDGESSSDPVWKGWVVPGEIDPNTTYADWAQKLRRRRDDPTIDLTVVGTSKAEIATDTQPPLFSAPTTLAGIQHEILAAEAF
ncbi:hypothetical protein [Mycolicibacillus trivialis]|uniref:Uncharacterized protein n=1 Tax=Mycolicibacillus trivialis TaxID=1798 RepID=A0A1X2EE03_9MYCO|nr:hypothetical protein [Mycolicibacillus trivialis]ORW98926.1 hypothetical protein AWC30_17070 [Mycolicibacillus trivialis]